MNKVDEVGLTLERGVHMHAERCFWSRMRLCSGLGPTTKRAPRARAVYGEVAQKCDALSAGFVFFGQSLCSTICGIFESKPLKTRGDFCAISL